MAMKSKRQQNDNTLPIMDLLYLCLGNWHWFALSLFVTLSIATLYILTTPSVYMSSASILIKDNSNSRGGSSSGFKAFSENYLSNAEEELKAIQSPAIITEASKRLDLDIEYSLEGRFHDPVIFGKELPAKIKLLDLGRNDNASLTMQVQSDSIICMWGFVLNGNAIEGFVRARDGEEVETPLGRILVRQTENVDKNINTNIKVSKVNLNKAIDYYYSNFTASFENKNTTIANLRMRDVSTYRGKAILEAIIDIYNEHWLIDKNQIVVSTDSFLNNRIELLQQELWQLDGEMATHKGRNMIQGEGTGSNLLIAEKSENEKEILTLTNQREIVQYLINILKDKKNYLLPNNIGLENTNIQNLASEYNKTLLRRNSVAQNSSDENPIVKDYDRRLSKLKETIVTAANNEIEAINSQIRFTRKAETSSNIALASSPEQAKKLQSIERQLKVKNALYLFLLQKREENELSKEYTASNTRIISAPRYSRVPIAPMKKNAILMALAIGLMLPTLIIFFVEIFNTKIRGRKDLEGMDIPFIGEIPMHIPEDKNEAKRAIQGKGEKNIVVKNGKRDIINEAFRVLRTNLRFITRQDEKCDVMVVTSFNPGSGKTFLAMNIAASLALKGEKVLVIDGDMRHGSTSAYIASPKRGISNYLNGDIDNIGDVIIPYPDYEGLYILPVGTIPPNPTELLNNKRLEELVARLRKEYNYIFFDCPPIDIVADTQIIEALADRTLFVIRTGLLERSMLDELEKIHSEKRLKNLALILNGTFSHGGYHRYGYRYGYRYSYRYGYKYGYSGKNK